jgi:uncharacterized protein (DUF302 family)
MADYGRRIVVGAPFNQVVGETYDAFRAEGFSLLARIELRDHLAREAHHDGRRYVLLSAYLPELTLQALQHDPNTGPALPAVIAAFELADGETAVTVSPPFHGLVTDFGWRGENPALAAIADRAAERVARAVDRLRNIARRANLLHAWSA